MNVYLTNEEIETILEGCRHGIQLETDTLSEGPDAWSEDARKEFKTNLKNWRSIQKKLRRVKYERTL